MEYIVDGFNVIKTSFVKKYEKYGIESGQEFLINILERYKNKHPSVEITVVFDGKFNTSIYQRKKIKVIFSDEKTADEKIREILEKKKSRSSISVVSDDREVQEF
ncbi:MAG: NYN domain-containing protein, partial [Candidatus Omnitrophica bacterium]|nr:NYN domain-containing protein [Candidatus Omnitrophota bacterium]